MNFLCISTAVHTNGVHGECKLSRCYPLLNEALSKPPIVTRGSARFLRKNWSSCFFVFFFFAIFRDFFHRFEVPGRIVVVVTAISHRYLIGHDRSDFARGNGSLPRLERRRRNDRSKPPNLRSLEIKLYGNQNKAETRVTAQHYTALSDLLKMHIRVLARLAYTLLHYLAVAAGTHV